MADAQFSRDFRSYQAVLRQAITQGKIFHLRSGEAGYFKQNVAGTSGTSVVFEPYDIVACTKPTGIVFLDGGQVYWDPTNNYTNFKRTTNTQQFFLGTAYGDAASADTTMGVQLNRWPAPFMYDLDLIRDEYVTVYVGTKGYETMGIFNRGRARDMILSTTNEAQKLDMLGVNSFAINSPCVVEMEINVQSGGAGSEPDFNVGVASATHATDADSIAQHLFMHIDGNSVNINFQSKDGTNTTAATDSTLDYTASTPFQVWFDMRDPASVAIYVDAVRVLSSTTFKVSAAASPWKLLAHVEKTAAATVFDSYVQFLRMRNATQSINGV